jgi:NMD protein affecting ribosome stability and mRNA decay
MGLVMIKCPNTGRSIPTGLKTDRSSFGATPVFVSRTFCQICQANHEWFAKNAWVREEGNESDARTVCDDRHQDHTSMERTVARLNIERFAKLLVEETDDIKRQMIVRLLMEEKGKLLTVDRAS